MRGDNERVSKHVQRRCKALSAISYSDLTTVFPESVTGVPGYSIEELISY
jgi:hypothetical protein